MAVLPPMPTASGRLLAALHAHGRLSRAEATTVSGLARSAAGTAVEELEQLGIIEVLPPNDVETRGRPSSVLGLRGTAPWVAVCELRVDSIRFTVGHLGRELGEVRTVRHDARSASPEVTIRTIAAHVRHLAAEVAGTCVAVGLSLPGIVDDERGVASAILALDWHAVPVRDMMQAVLPEVPVVIGQDAEFAAVGEHRVGAGVGSERLLFLLGQAVGLGGLVVGSLSEWTALSHHHPLQAGHIVVDPDGPQCLCGARGCLEVFVDGRALARVLGRDHPLAPEEFTAMAAAGLTAAEIASVRRQIVPKLAIGLLSLVNVLGPDRVVLGGVLGPILEFAQDDLRTALRLSVVADVGNVSLVRSTLKEAVLVGAAEAALQPLLMNPRGVINRHTHGLLGAAPDT